MWWRPVWTPSWPIRGSRGRLSSLLSSTTRVNSKTQLGCEVNRRCFPSSLLLLFPIHLSCRPLFCLYSNWAPRSRVSKIGKHRIQSDCDKVSPLTWLEIVTNACDHFNDSSCIVAKYLQGLFVRAETKPASSLDSFFLFCKLSFSTRQTN